MRKLLLIGALLVLAVPASAARLPILPSQDVWPVYSPDGARVAFTRIYNRHLELWVVDLRSHKVTHVGSNGGQLAPTWVAAERIAWSSGGVLWVARPDGTGKTRYLAPLPSYAPAARPNTEQLAYLTHHGAQNLDLRVGNALWATNAIGQPAWSPDGAQVAFRRDDGIYVATAPQVERKVVSIDNPGGLAWSSDGTRIAYLSHGALYIVMAAGGPSVLKSRDVPANALAPSWSIDDARISADRAWSPVDNSFVQAGPRAGCPGHSVLRLNGTQAVTGSCTTSGTAGNDVIEGTQSWGDVILAGAGNDKIHVGDRHTDRVNCGPGRDEVWADKTDKLTGCEIVHR